MISKLTSSKLLLFIPFVFLLTACAAGDSQFSTDEPAGFLYGIWHGVIAVISLIIHVFNDNVLVYETSNIGGWYDFGFLIGIICVWSGGSKVCCKPKARREKDKEWEEVSNKVEIKIMRKLKEWADDEENTDTKGDWDDVGEKVEKKLKRIIKEWAEKD